MSIQGKTRRIRGGFVVCVLLAAFALASGCGKDEGDKPQLQGNAASKTKAGPADRLAIVSAASRYQDNQSQIVLTFNEKLAASQEFDSRVDVVDKDGAPVKGSWQLEDDQQTLVFPYVQANQHYAVTVHPTLLAASGHAFTADEKRDVFSGNLPPALGFASHGSVLPARGARGLPVVSMNVEDANIEFFRIHDDALSQLFCAYPGQKRRGDYELDHDTSRYNTCNDEDQNAIALTQLGDSVYANHYTLKGEPNARTVSYIPVQDIPQLKQPGVYMAVLRRGGVFRDEYDTATFFVSDLGLHLRVYKDNALLHVASLEDGGPISGVDVEITDQNGASKLKAKTDKDGNALIAYKPDRNDVLIARHDKDVSVLPFNRPALDVSNFDVSGRRQAPFEVYAWSGRDLYRPGEDMRVSALLRDYDGKAMKAQPVYVRLKQPDGRALADTKIEPRELNYFELKQTLPADAATGLWQLEFRLDPASKESVQAFPFHVEEFLPERLKVALDAQQARVMAGEALNMSVASSYLFGAPAADNRFTARLFVKPEQHPVASMKDTFFGDPLAPSSTPSEDAVDVHLDEKGETRQELAMPDDLPPTTPYAMVVSGSVYESGGRAVTRVLNRTFWPAPELVGVRPLFDPKQGAESEANAAFEIVRANVDGKLVAGQHLKVRLQREVRDFYWMYEHGNDWKSNQNVSLQLVEERDIDLAAGQRAKVDFPVEWGGYRLEVYDPATKLTTNFPFFAGYSWEDQNLGKEARPDKIKLALDKARYRTGDTLKVTVTPPQPGPGVLLVESDHLLYTKDIDVKASSTFEIPVTADWERHDVHVVALVFRGGKASDKTTPARAMGIEHVTMDRNDRQLPLTLQAPATMRPGQPLPVTVHAEGMGGQKGFVTLAAVDQGVLNITNYPVPDAWAWMFAPRAMVIDAYDLYSRVIEAMDGAVAKVRYGGDMSGDALPHAQRPNPKVKIVDLFAGPVQFDASGNAKVSVDVPDFNGTLRISALAFTDQRFGHADGEVVVRAPLIVEPGMPRVMAGGDKARITIDLKNMSGKDGVAKVSVKTDGLVHVDNPTQQATLKNGAGTVLTMPVTASAGVGVATVDIHAELNDFSVDRHFEFTVRSGWPEDVQTVPMAIEGGKPVKLDGNLAGQYAPSTVNARITLSTLPPLPYNKALKDLLKYPYGCIEQTTSKGFAALFMDEATGKALGVAGLSPSGRQSAVEAALARIASFQADKGHFSFWGGTSPIQTFMTPYVVDFMLDARDAGFVVPQDVLQKALKALNDDLLAGGHPYYGYEQHDHMRIADEAYSGFVLARVNRAPLGTLRTLFDNERGKLVGPLPLVHLGIALKLMGDEERGRKAVDEAFAWTKERPWYVGDYGSDLRDLGQMVALTHAFGMSKPEYDARLVDWARNATNRARGAEEKTPYYHWSWSYLSTQEQVSIARVAHTFDAGGGRPLSASLQIGGATEAAPAGKTMWVRDLTPAESAAGVTVQPGGEDTVFATLDIAGIPLKAPAADPSQVDVRRAWFTTDGKAWEGDKLKEGDTLIAELTIEARQDMPDALVTDLLPGGLEVENLNLGGARQWEGTVVDGIDLAEHASATEAEHEEYRDDRYAAAVKLRRGDAIKLFYIVRAVTPGTYVVPPPLVEDMYRPAIRGVGKSTPVSITVVEP